MANSTQQQATESVSVFGKTIETLNALNGRDPSWHEIIRSLTGKTEKGENASVMAASEAYFDENGFVRMLDRVETRGMASTPDVSLEQLIVSEYSDNKEFYEYRYISYDDGGNENTETEPMERAYSILAPGYYSVVTLRYKKMQSEDKRKLYNALENYYEELIKIAEDLEKRPSAKEPLPILMLTFVPMLYGGRYSVSFTDPILWHEREEEEGPVLSIFFESKNVIFSADPGADPEETFQKCRSELASEWIREEQKRRIEAEEAQYKKNTEEEINKFLENSRIKQHTFQSTKAEDRYLSVNQRKEEEAH